MPYSVPKLLLAAGVTSIRTAGSEAPQVDLALKKRLDEGRAPGPHLSVTGGYLNAASGGFLGDTVTETAEQAAFLLRHGCNQAQGYMYGKPVAPDEVLARWKDGGVAIARRYG